MELDALREALKTGELYEAPERRPILLRDPFVIYEHHVVRADIEDDDTTDVVHTADGLSFNQAPRRARIIELELTLDAGRALGTCWHKGGLDLDIHIPPQRVHAKALKCEPIWIPGIEGERDPTPANEGCYRIIAEIIQVEKVHVACTCDPVLPEFPLGHHRTWCPTRKNRG